MRYRYIFLSLFAWISFCLFLFYGIYQIAKDKAVADLNARQSIHIHQAAKAIEWYFDHWVILLTRTAQMDSIIHLDTIGKKYLEFILESHAQGIEGISRVDQSGRIVYTLPYDPKFIGADLSGQKHIQKIMKTRQPVLSGAFRTVQGFDALALHVPVTTAAGDNVGMISILLNFEVISKRFLENITIGQTGYAWVVDKDGIELFCPVPGHVGNSVFDNCRDFPTILSMAREMLQGHEGVTTYLFDRIRGDKKETVLKHAVYMPIRIIDTFWSIVVASSEDEVLNSLTQFKNRLLLVIGMLFVGALFFSFYGIKSWIVVKEEKNRQEAQAVLAKSEGLLNAIVETARDSIFIKDNALKYMRVNQAMASLFGMEKETIIGLTDSDLFGKESAQHIEPIDRRVLTGESVEEYPSIPVHGVMRHFHIITVPLKDHFGRITGLCGIARDITERINSEEALRESENRLRMIMENTSSLIAVLDDKGIYEFVNPAHRILGCEPDELVGTSGFELIHPDDRERLVLILHKGLRGELTKIKTDYRVVGKDGRTYFIEGTFDSIWSTGGELKKIVFIGDDVTERKRIRDALAHKEKMLAVVIMETGSGTWEWYVKTGKVVYNERWAEIVGYTLEELQPVSIQTWMDLCHPEDLKRSRELVYTHFSQKYPYYACECRLRHKAGHWIWVDDRGKVVEWSEDGKPLLMAGISMDITQRKQAEEEKTIMEAQNRQLQKAKSLGLMAGAIAHHFNNQLQVVMGNLELAMADLPPNSGPDNPLAQASMAARKAAGVSGLMLTYLGQTPGKQEAMDLSDVCRQSLRMLHDAMPKHMVVKADLPDPGPVIIANTSRIHQVLTHLLTNAWESLADPNRTVYLTVTTVLPENIATTNRFPVDWKPGNTSYACIEVRDSGCGIAQKDIETLFDPFFTTKFSGRGLGLPVILGIVRANTGGVTVESEPGQGSVFRIFLPVSGQKATAPSDKPHKPSRIADGSTILLIEDEEMVRKMVVAMLSQMAITVIPARDGIEAVELFRQHQDTIHCVLTDLTMPRMSGWEAISALRSIRPDIPVILASGYDEANVMEDNHPDMPQVFLHKPFSAADLKAALEKVIGATSAEHNGQVAST